MGNSHAHPDTTFDVTDVPLIIKPDSFMIQRTSGLWEEHRLCFDPEEWGAYRESGKVGKQLPAATKTSHGGKYGAVQSRWRIFMCQGFRDTEGVSGWRTLDKIRPFEMTEEDAQEWRKAVENELEKLTKTVEIEENS